MANEEATVSQTVNTVTVTPPAASTLSVTSATGGTLTSPESTASLVAVTVAPSTASLTIESKFAPKHSPVFTGAPLAPTASAGTNNTQIATTAYVDSAVSLENTLVEMDDVNITSISDNELLQYDSSSSKWINQTISETGLALLASPDFTGNPTAPTQSAGNNSTRIATTAYVDNAVASEDALSEMGDVSITNLADNELLQYSSSASKWINQTFAEAGVAPVVSPNFSGTPLAPTASAATNSTQIATTAYVTTAVSNLIDSAPAALDTLNELAAALNDDASFSTTVTNSIATKLPLAGGTMTGSIVLNDDVKAIFGTSSDGLEIYHDGSNSIIKDSGTGVLNIQGSTQVNIGGVNGQNGVQYIEGGAVRLRHNNVVKLDTTSTGVTITGELVATSLDISNDVDIDGTTNLDAVDIDGNVQLDGTLTVGVDDTGHDVKFFGATSGKYMLWDESDDILKFPDSTEINLGTGGDLRIYHDGTNNYIKSQNSADLYIHQGANDKDIIFECDDGSGGVTEYFRLDGSSATHDGSATTSLYTYWPDNSIISLGSSKDFSMYHTGTKTLLNNLTGNLEIRNSADDGDIIFQSDDGSGGTETYFYLDGSASSGNPKTKFPDNSRLGFGADADLYLYHDGSHSYMINDVGHLYIRNQTDDNDIIFQCDDGSGGTETYFRLDGSVGGASPYTVFPDDSRLAFGTVGDGSYMHLLHDATNSYIENKHGHLFISNYADDKDIIFQADDGSGGNETYFYLDGSLNSGNYPITVFPDDSSLCFGDGRDLVIAHNGTDTNINNYVGHLNIINRADDKDIVFYSDDGSGGVTTYLQLDGGNTLTYFAKPTKHADSTLAGFGTDNDLRIFHNATNSLVENITGDLQFIQYADNKMIRFYNDNGSGGTIEYLRVDGSEERTVFSKDARLLDDIKLNFGASSDLKIYHDGSNSYIRDESGTGDLIISTNAFRLKSANNGETMMTAFEDGATNLYHNNVQKFETTSTGIAITGGLTTTGASTLSSTLTVGVDDTGHDVKFFGATSGTYFHWDESQDKLILNEASLQIIDATPNIQLYDSDTANQFNIDFNGADVTFKAATTDGDIIFQADNGSGGLDSYLRIDGGAHTLDVFKQTHFYDSVKATFGTGNDLQIYHDGTHSYIDNSSTFLILESDNIILRNNAGDEDYAKFLGDGAVELYHNDVKKFETTAAGATVTGNLTVSADLIINGTTTTVNSTTVTIDDPVFTLGGDSAPSSDDNKDRGIEFRYHNGSAAKIGFFGWDDSASVFTFIADASPLSEVYSGSAGNVAFGNIAGTLTTAAQGNITSLGTLTTLTVDDITINGSTISDAGDLTIDVGGDIILDADGGDVLIKDGGTQIGQISKDISSSNFVIKSSVNDADLEFKGVDGGANITALRLDMSDAGSAIFNHNIALPSAGEIDWDGGDVKFVHSSNALTFQGATNGLKITADGSNATALVESGDGNFKIDTVLDLTFDAGGGDIILSDDGTIVGTLSMNQNGGDFEIRSRVSDKDLVFKGNDGGSEITALTIDMSAGGKVGIGTTSPARKLSVNSGEIITAMFESTSNQSRVSFNDSGTSGNNYVGAGSSGDNLTLFAGAAEKARLTSGGKLGIGTTSPARHLHINGGGTNVLANFESTDAGAYLSFSDDSTSNDTSVRLGANGNDFQFFAGGSERVRIDSTGKVGILTTSPASFLDVRGTVQVGVDDTGHDVKFFGATAGSYMLWDESQDALILGGVAPVLKFVETDATTTFNTTDFSLSGGALNINTRQSDGSFVSTDYQITKNASGASIHKFFIAGTEKAQINSTGVTLTGALTVGVDDTGHDVKFYGDTAGSFMLWDASQDRLELTDDSRIVFGDGADASIWHGGTDTYIENATGDLVIRNQADDKDIIFQCDDGSGGLETYFYLDGSVSSGNPFTVFPDLSELAFGTGRDLRIKHDGTDSIISNNGGDLYIRNKADDKDVIFECDNGSGGYETYFYLDGSASSGDPYTKFPDNSILGIGDSADLKIFHNATNTFIENNTGDLFIKNGANDKDILFQCDDGSGGTETYFYLDGSANSGNPITKFPDSSRLVFGDAGAGDMALYHDGTNNYINTYTGDLILRVNADDKDIHFQSDDGSGGTTDYLKISGANDDIRAYKNIKFADTIKAVFGDGSDLEIYHDGTNSRLNNETGDLIFTQNANDKDIKFNCDNGSGNVETYFYLDGSASSGNPITIFPDNSYLQFGTGMDLGIVHNGTNALISNTTGNIKFTNYADDADIKFECDDGSGGVTEYFRVDGGATNILFSKELRLLDGVQIQLGTSLDMLFMHNGANGAITNNTGNLIIKNNNDDGDIIFECDDGSGGIAEYFRLDGGLGYLFVSKTLNFADNVPATFGPAGDLNIRHDGTDSSITNNTGDLYVRNTADDKDIIFKADAGGTEAEIMRIDGSTGRVGIGATSPDSALELEVASAGSTQTRCFHIDHNPTGNSGSGYMTIRSGTNTGASASLEQVSSGGGSLYGTYSDTNLINHGTQTSGAYNNINFVTNEAIRMTIGGGTQAGNVGIGTTSPAEKFHVSNGASGFSGSYNARTTAIIESDNSAGTALSIMGKNTGNSAIFFGDQDGETVGQVFYNNPSNYLAFGASGATQAVVNGTGLGIGTTSPSEKLHVSGNARIGNNTTNGHLIGRKDYSVTQTFTTGLTVTLADHTACHVKVFISGDWSGHSSFAYVGEFFIQNTGNVGSYNEPGIILTEHDNLTTDGILSQIVDGTSDSFEIQFRANTSSATSVSGRLCYHVMGDATSVS